MTASEKIAGCPALVELTSAEGKVTVAAARVEVGESTIRGGAVALTYGFFRGRRNIAGKD